MIAVRDLITIILVIIILRLLCPPPHDILFLFLCSLLGVVTGVYRARHQIRGGK